MLLPGSRYEDARPFVPSPDGADLLRPRDVPRLPGAVEHVLSAGDRADLLAREYHGDARSWYRILDANPHVLCAADLEDTALQGHVIVIPGGTPR
jgi:hypothetical protein